MSFLDSFVWVNAFILLVENCFDETHGKFLANGTKRSLNLGDNDSRSIWPTYTYFSESSFVVFLQGLGLGACVERLRSGFGL